MGKYKIVTLFAAMHFKRVIHTVVYNDGKLYLRHYFQNIIWMRKIFPLIVLSLLLWSCGNETDKPKKSKFEADIPQNKDAEATFKGGEESFSAFVQKNMVLPKLARYYGINAQADIEVTIDTAGNIISTRPLTESIDLNSGIDTTLQNYRAELSGMFVMEAERIIWLSNKKWEISDPKETGKFAATQVLNFDFITKQYDDNKSQLEAGKKLELGKFDLIKDDPSAANFYQMGTWLLTQGYYTDAARFLNTSIRIDKSQPDSWFNLGLAYRAVKRYDKACTSFKRASELGDQEATEMLRKMCDPPA